MSNYIFYKIVCKDKNITDCYVGQTTDFIVRYRLHKSKCTNPNSDKYNIKVYEFIRDNGGWNEWEMIEIETCMCKNDFYAREIERCWIKCLGANLNCIIPNRTDEEYYQDNIEHITEYKHSWYEKNKERIALEAKQRYIENKKQHAETTKKYYEAHKEHLKQNSKEWYEQNKEHCLEKQKIYNQLHKEQVAERQKAYALANKERLAKYKKEWYERKKLEKQQNNGN